MYCNRRLFWLTAAVYGLNWLCYLLSIFWVEMHRWMVVFFFPVFIYIIIMLYVMKKNDKCRKEMFLTKLELKNIRGWRAVLIGLSGAVALLTFVIAMVCLVNGSGEIIDGVYWLTNKGDLVRQITWEEYSKLIRAEASMVYGFFLFPTANPLAYYAEERSQFREKIKA